MPLEQWLKNGWLKAHQPSRNEIAGLLAIIERDVADAQAMGEVFPERKADVHYLDACRAKRNTAEYDCAGVVTKADADELIGFVREFKPVVFEWLCDTHPELI